jgi:peptidoglycan/LPS O-acetylase OafA/YrhL
MLLSQFTQMSATTSCGNTIAYRPDIDSLRAIAVLLVIFFHAGLPFPGGFIGVDVFFVISGYLITGIILKQLNDNSFSLRDFFARRICRLLPAMQVVILSCLVFGYFFQLPQTYKELANSACYQQLLSANIFFWKNTGYFHGDAELKPLLHTWSLAVEEQFYIFFSLLLMITWRFLRDRLAIFLFVLTAVSMILSEYAAHNHRSAAFFLLPTRSWELMLGSLIWFLPENLSNYGRAKRLLTFLSLCSLLAVSLLYTKATTFPGFHALIPCLATATVIYLGNHSQNSFSMLQRGPLVTLGLISYSLYLWHWPIFAFSRELLGADLNLWLRLSLCGLAFLIAFLSWKYIEQPFRFVKVKHLYALILLSTVPIVYLAACVIERSNGIPSRVPERFLRYQSAAQSIAYVHEITSEEAISGKFPVYGDSKSKRKCVVWGDSHAMSLMPGIVAAASEMNIAVIQATHSSTPPIRDFIDNYETGLNEDTPVFADAVISYCTANNVNIVILAGAWYSYVRNPQFEQKLAETISTLESKQITVAFVHDIPIQKYGPREFAMRAWWKLNIDFAIPAEKHAETNSRVRQILLKCITKNTITVEPSSFFASKDRYVGEANGKIYYRDNQHLSIDGGLILKPAFSNLFSRIEDNKGSY